MPYDSLSFSLPWILPFVGFLLSLALIPLVASKLWHKFYKGIIAGWIASFLIAFGWSEGLSASLSMLFHALLHHYIPFMALITVLFTVGGGIHISMRGKASPLLNVSLLAFGALLANFVGTTGASMLLIRPLIALNKYRLYTTHVVIFFIFLVSNIGGILTPMGDPPLFIGFLNGVDFFWTTTNLLYPFLIVGGAVLALFWLIDHYYFYHDPSVPDPEHLHGGAKVHVKGAYNLILLSAAIAIILIESMATQKPHLTIWGEFVNFAALSRDLILFALAYASWRLTPEKIHESNHFNFEPLEEVALVFLGIFITVIPVLSILKAGDAGPLRDILHLANPNGIPDVTLYFWLTGLLSSILDNAPTYLIFFNMAGGEAPFLMTQGSQVLAAISTGAVFMGALTYIGNAPNFMVRSIAARSHIKMPSFLGYLIWSATILLPVFWGFSWFWFP
ncbi:MAG: sodium:proton antiporter [Alphaproteobacteria bacterium]|jgi:Na+/H+ antiporter NhaD/arsenite permease-like protein|nr:sodium:proton antiporter [Alphaproteobacteria bacterium]